MRFCNISSKEKITLLTKTIEKIRPSIFQIQIQTLTNTGIPSLKPIGTGFAVSNEGLLVTALHVGEAAEMHAKTGGQMMAAFAGPDFVSANMKIRSSFIGTSFKIVERNRANDLALLKLPTEDLGALKITVGPGNLETSPKPCELKTIALEDGEEVAISGYPLNLPSMVTTSGHIASSWTLHNGQDHFLADVTANPGNSGGPVYGVSDGSVIGVCVAGPLTEARSRTGQASEVFHASGLTYVAPASAIETLISSYNQRHK